MLILLQFMVKWDLNPHATLFLFSQNEAVTSMLVNQGVTILGLLKTFMVAFRKTLSLDSALKKTTVNYISL